MRRWILWVAFAAPWCLVFPVVADDVEPGWPITVQAESIPPGDPASATQASVDRVGQLRYRSVLHLTSEHEDFGGFSGLTLLDDRLVAVSDRGHWLTAELELDEEGTLSGLKTARMGQLCDDDGPVAWERVDAEEIHYLPGRGYLVSFERHHRIVLYPDLDDVPQPFPFPPAVITTRRNKGMEAVTPLRDGRLLALAEDLRTVEGDLIGWIGDPEAGDWQHVSLPAVEDFQPTSATLLPDGDVLLLIRSYRKEIGTRIRLLRIAASSLIADSRLQPIELARIEHPETIDNMESVAVSAGPQGEILIYLLSDDNFSAHQRTLLMELELLPNS